MSTSNVRPARHTGSRSIRTDRRSTVAKKRDEIKMSEDEVSGFLAQERVMTVSTLGVDGWPHLTALWFVMRDGEPWIYTYAKSQKVRNLERDPRATLMVESGHAYNELRGVMLKSRAELHRDVDAVARLAEEITLKYYVGDGGGEIDDSMREVLRKQATKRVAIQFHVEETASWDHAKLGGAY
jgi:PPOX class probable F420-dependent enzyme